MSTLYYLRCLDHMQQTQCAQTSGYGRAGGGNGLNWDFMVMHQGCRLMCVSDHVVDAEPEDAPKFDELDEQWVEAAFAHRQTIGVFPHEERMEAFKARVEAGEGDWP